MVIVKYWKYSAPSSLLVPSSLRMTKFNALVNRLPTAIYIMKNAMTNDFMVFGAWMYKNSRQVIDSITAADVGTR